MTYYQNAAGLPPEHTIAIGPMLVPRTDLNCVELTGNISTAATTNLYTVPTGKIAIIPIAYTNNVGLAANTTSFSVRISVAGASYRLTTDSSTTSASSQARLMNYIFAEDDTLQIVTSTSSQINYRASIIELPSTYPIFSAVLSNFTGGGTADTLYTLPAGKQAYVWGNPPLSIYNPIIYMAPNIGSSPDYNFYTVPNGSSASSSTQSNIQKSAVNGSVYNNPCASHLENAGDSYMISSSVSTSGQMGWVNIIELPIQPSHQNLVCFPPKQSFFPGAFGFNSTQASSILSLTNISSATTTDLYTVPSNYKLLLRGIQVFTTSGTCTYVLKVKIGGNYYIIDSPAGTSVAVNVATTINGTFVLEAGQSVACTTSGSGIAGNIYVNGILVPDTIPTKTVYLSSFTGGGTADVIYTLPSGKSAYPIGIDFNSPFSLLTCAFGITNSSGATRTYVAYTVPNGGSAGTNTLAGTNTVANNGTINKQSGLPISMSLITAGDTIQVSSDSSAANQFAWTNIIEVDA